MPGRSVARRGDREVIDIPHQPVRGHGKRVARQEAGTPEGGDRRQVVKSHREQGTLPDVFWRTVLVVADDGALPPPRQVAAPNATGHGAEVTAEVQQRQILKRHRGPRGERG